LIREDAAGSQVHAQLIKDAVSFAASNKGSYPDVDEAELAAEVMMVKLALRIVPHLKGYSHIQSNPKYSYNKQKTIENGKRRLTITPPTELSEVDRNFYTRNCVDIQGS
jgi:transaldolase